MTEGPSHGLGERESNQAARRQVCAGVRTHNSGPSSKSVKTSRPVLRHFPGSPPIALPPFPLDPTPRHTALGWTLHPSPGVGESKNFSWAKWHSYCKCHPLPARARLNPALRANPYPEVTDLTCRLPLPTLVYRPEASHLGDLLRIRYGPARSSSLKIIISL